MRSLSTPLDELKRDRLIRSWAKESKAQLDHLLPNKPAEADLRHRVEPLLDGSCIRVPKFDPKNKVHQRLSELSMQAHEAKEKGDTAQVAMIEAEVNQRAARLWGLTDAELAENQKSLNELTQWGSQNAESSPDRPQRGSNVVDVPSRLVELGVTEKRRLIVRTRSHRIKIALFYSAIALILGCTTTELVNIWKDPSLQGPRLNHVLVIAMRKDPVRRRLWEDAFVAQLAEYGVTAAPSYRAFPNEIPDTNQVRDIVTREGFNGVLITHALPNAVSIRNVPGSISTEVRMGYNPWKKRYDTYYENVLNPAHVDSTPIYRYQVDVLMPTGAGGQLIWSGTSTTTEPNTVEDLQRDVAGLVVGTLSKQAVIPSRQK